MMDDANFIPAMRSLAWGTASSQDIFRDLEKTFTCRLGRSDPRVENECSWKTSFYKLNAQNSYWCTTWDTFSKSHIIPLR